MKMERSFVFAILIVLLIGCSKQTVFQNLDEEFLITSRDFIQYQNYEQVPMKNGWQYFYSYNIDKKFGLYSFYSTTVRNKKDKSEIKWSVKANKFYKAEDIERLFKSSSQMKLPYKDYVIPLDIEKYNGQNGFCIKSPDYFQFVITKDDIMLDLTIEGEHKMELGMMDSVVIKHLNKISQISLDVDRESVTKKLL